MLRRPDEVAAKLKVVRRSADTAPRRNPELVGQVCDLIESGARG